jgi:para-nitrobenzyl esterase
MKSCLFIVALKVALGLAMTPLVFAQQPPPAMGHADKLALTALPPKAGARLTVSSPAFKDGDDIPLENTQYRGNVFPGLVWTVGPKATRSYVVIMQGESLSGTSTSIHLTLFNLPASVTHLDAGLTNPPSGATYGPNVHGSNQPYAGPHTHTPAKQRYHLQVFALDTVVGPDPNLSFEALESAMTGHVLASGELVGLAAMDPVSELHSERPGEAGRSR